MNDPETYPDWVINAAREIKQHVEHELRASGKLNDFEHLRIIHTVKHIIMEEYKLNRPIYERYTINS